MSVNPELIRVNSWLIWKNKANFKRAKINVISFITRGYERYVGLDTWWKQTQFKANSVVLPPRTPSARRFLMCKNSRLCSWLGDFVSSAFSANSAVNRIWKNKANLRKGRIGVSIYMKGYYEEFYALKAAKNKANQSQSPAIGPEIRSNGWPNSQ